MKDKFLKILSEKQILSDPESLETFGRDWVKSYRANPSLILFPSSYEEVQKIMEICSKEVIHIVPSGGRTGLSGGATAMNGEVVLCLDKLNKILEINETEQTVTCQAGTITQTLQDAAKEHGLYFPVDFASKGSSQIGGNLATNAGGIRVVRYGNIRDWVLGIKIVTASGELLDLNGSLYKNQTGYDLKNLIIGSEGTLAVIVEATLRVTRPPKNLRHIICGLDSLEDVLTLFNSTRKQFPQVSVFEYFSRSSLEEVLTKHQLKEPLTEKCNEYALLEIEENAGNFDEALEEFLGKQLENGLVTDAVLSQNSAQSEQLIQYRELIPESLNSTYMLHKNDIAVPISRIPAFVKELRALIAKFDSGIKAVVFGHIGDGNLHLNTLNISGMQEDDFRKRCKQADAEIFKLISKYKGSISAEHGIGLLKKDFLNYSRSASEVTLMKEIKRVFDPKGIFNPGKIF